MTFEQFCIVFLMFISIGSLMGLITLFSLYKDLKHKMETAGVIIDQKQTEIEKRILGLYNLLEAMSILAGYSSSSSSPQSKSTSKPSPFKVLKNSDLDIGLESKSDKNEF